MLLEYLLNLDFRINVQVAYYLMKKYPAHTFFTWKTKNPTFVFSFISPHKFHKTSHRYICMCFFFGTTSLQKSRGLFIKILADKRYLIIENHVFSQNNLHYLCRIVAFSAHQSAKKAIAINFVNFRILGK